MRATGVALESMRSDARGAPLEADHHGVTTVRETVVRTAAPGNRDQSASTTTREPGLLCHYISANSEQTPALGGCSDCGAETLRRRCVLEET
jgi:hypothetical protein